MLYLIGGAARVGKTRLARRLLVERNIPCFCVDYFVSALEQGVPGLGIVGESPNVVRAPKLWPVIAPLLRNLIKAEPAYTVEGDALWPTGVSALRQAYPGQVRACFLGYAHTTPRKKLAAIRQYGGGVNDWLQEHTDKYILDLVREMIDYSRLVRQACDALGLPYVDTSDDFAGGLEQAYWFLTAPTVS